MKRIWIFMLGLLCGVTVVLAAAVAMSRVKPEWGRALARQIVPSEIGDLMGGERNGGHIANKGTAAEEGGRVDVEGRDEEGADGTEYTLEQQIAFLREWTQGKWSPRQANGRWYGAVRAWASADPKAALAFIAGAKRFPERNAALAFPLGVMAAKDPQFAIDWIVQNIPEANRRELASMVMHLTGDEAPEKMLALVTSDKLKMDSSDVAWAFAQLAKTDAEQAMRAFAQLPEAQQADSAKSLLGYWSYDNYDAASAWCMQQRGGKLEAVAMEAAINMCLSQNPEDIDRVLQTYPGALKLITVDSMSELLARDPDLGLMLMQELPANVREQAVRSFSWEGVRYDPEGTMAIIRATLSEAEQADVINAAFSSWMSSDQRGAMEWLDTLADVKLAQSIRERLEAERTNDEDLGDPREILARVTDPAAGVQTDASKKRILRALSNLVDSDPAAAAEWARANPTLVPSSSGSYLAYQYLHYDEVGAAAWLAALPQGGVRDAAVDSAAFFWAGEGEAELATQAAYSLQDPDRRMATLYSVFCGLRTNDEASALSWLAGQSLTDEVKRSWLATTRNWNDE